MNHRRSIYLILALLGILLSKGVAAVETGLEPNFFQLRDLLGGTVITLDRHSATPVLTYTRGTKNLSVSGENFVTETTAIGTLITVTTKINPDINFITLSFLLPNASLPDPDSILHFTTSAVITKHRTPFIVAPITGVTEIYTVPIVLNAIAKFVGS